MNRTNKRLLAATFGVALLGGAFAVSDAPAGYAEVAAAAVSQASPGAEAQAVAAEDSGWPAVSSGNGHSLGIKVPSGPGAATTPVSLATARLLCRTRKATRRAMRTSRGRCKSRIWPMSSRSSGASE